MQAHLCHAVVRLMHRWSSFTNTHAHTDTDSHNVSITCMTSLSNIHTESFDMCWSLCHTCLFHIQVVFGERLRASVYEVWFSNCSACMCNASLIFVCVSVVLLIYILFPPFSDAV